MNTIRTEKISTQYFKQRSKTYTWTQRFKESWRKLFPWVEPASDGSNFVQCLVCNKRLRCKKDDIFKHSKGQKHKLNLQKASPNNLESITLYTSPGTEDDNCDEIKVEQQLHVDPCPKISSNRLVMCGVDIQPEVQGAIEALTHKMTTLSAELAEITDPISVEKCSHSLSQVINILARLKKL
ncbi:uncharacterized protein LOC108665042 [Hyalella azteca]|uniref:Uncharacterized protein LOC108665042 n=1 Tax=Hyalella azteca TaxID=294128 RepID=A0A8B7N123_HYAAZ|nr:uncharacterized protein LOC108665042 [Hyalella azteca]